MIHKVLVCLLPLWANSDPTGLDPAEVEAATKYEVTYGLNRGLWSVYTLPNGEWLTDFGRCEVLGVYGEVVYLYEDELDKSNLDDQRLVAE